MIITIIDPRENIKTEILEATKILCPSVDFERRIKMANALTEFVTDALLKFERGTVEHSDSDIETCNLPNEIRNELLDLFWYTTAQKWISDKRVY